MSNTVVHIRCMDRRHTGQVHAAIEKKVGGPIQFYELTEPGGAGVLLDLFGKEVSTWLLTKTDIAVNKLHAEEVYLSVHGTSDEDGKPCGGYALSGFTEEFTTPEKSRAFLTEELKKSAKVVQNKLPNTKIRAFYITFSADGTNLVEEVNVA